MADCFTAGSITGAVIGTFVATLILLGIIWLIYNKMKKRKVQKSGLTDLVIVEEGRGDKPGTYDNPAFVEDSMDPKKTRQSGNDNVMMNGSKKPMSSDDTGKKMPWGPFRFLFKSRSALDDSVIEEPQRYNVALRGHDFTGLGFNICGNMKDGIYVKDVMQRGPASESKHIVPGDQITGMTVSFKQMVLEDAVTLLSYASPYEVSLEMMRHPEKSLHHKGLFVSSSTGSGQSGTLERVCHPFFKSQSIDDLRKVGKDLQVSRGKKQANGMKLFPSSTTTMDIPTVAVVGTNEPRSSSHKKSPQFPNANLSLGSGKISLEAHHQKPTMSVDEVDSPRGPIVPEIKVSTNVSKPEIIPRAKSKVTNLKKDAPDVKVVEAISPVVKMSADFEKMVEEHSISKQMSSDVDMKGPKPAIIDVESMQVSYQKPSIHVKPMQMKMQAPINLHEKMPSMVLMDERESHQVKSPHVEIEMTGPELGLDDSPVKKPRGQKSKDKSDKNKEKETKKQKEGEGDHEPQEKSKFGKFGFNLPELSLNFGKGGTNKSAEDKEKAKEMGEESGKMVEDEMTKEKSEETKMKPEKEKKDKSSKGSKDKDKKEMSPASKVKSENVNENEPSTEGQEMPEKKPLEKSSSSGFGFHLKFPSFDKPILKRKDSSGEKDGGEIMVDKDPGANKTRSESPSKPPKALKSKDNKEKKTKDDSRPTSPSSKESDDSSMDNNETMMKPYADDVTDSADVSGEKSKKGGFHMPHLGIKLPKFGHSKQTYSFENAGDGSAKEGKSYQSEIPKTIEESHSMSSSVKVELTADTPDLANTAKHDDATMKMSSPVDISKSKKSATSEVVEIHMAEGRPSSPVGVSYGLYPPSVESEIKDKEAMSLGRSRSPTPLGDRGKDKMMKSEEDLTEKEGGKGEKSGESKPGLVSKVLRDLKEKVSGKRSHDVAQQQQQHHGSSSEDEGGDENGKVGAKEKAKLDKKVAKEAREKAVAEAKKEKEKLKAEKKAKKAELKVKKQAMTSGHSDDSWSSSSDESDADDKDKKLKKEKKKSKSKEKSVKPKDKEKKVGKKGTTSPTPTPVETIEIETFEMSTSQSTEVVSQQSMVSGGGVEKPPVVPRKSKDSGMTITTKETSVVEESKHATTMSLDKKSKDKTEKQAKDKKTKEKKGDDSSSSSSSSSSSDSEDDTGRNKESGVGKPKKPKRSAKRKAPVPPSASELGMTTITTEADVILNPNDIVTSSDVTLQMNESYAKTPESGRRSASFGDLSTLQPKLKLDNMDRTMSLDMAAENEQMSPTSSAMPMGAPLEDLSADPDPEAMVPHFNRMQSPVSANPRLGSSLSSSSSSETLKAAPTSVVHVHPKESAIMPPNLTYGLTPTNTSNSAASSTPTFTHGPTPSAASPSLTYGLTPTSHQISISSPYQQDPSEFQRMMDETISTMNSTPYKMDSPSLVLSVPEREHSLSESGVTFSTPSSATQYQSTPMMASGTSNTVTISSRTQGMMDRGEVEKVAQQTVDDIIAHVNKGGGRNEVSLHANGGESRSVKVESHSTTESSGRNVTVTSIQQQHMSSDEKDDHHLMMEGDESSASTKASETKPCAASLLRGDSKSRLMQTVADANTIKVNPISPLRKDSSMSSSSSSVDSSPEVRMDSTKPLFPDEVDQTTTTPRGQTIEISAKELDGIMMSHAEFLQKQSTIVGCSTKTTPTTTSVTVNMTPDSLEPIKDASFDNWVYVEQTNAANKELTCAHSHSDPEPSTSSSNDDDDVPYNRNGALSPSSYKMETEYKYATSEMLVTSSPIPSGESHSPTTTTVYATTMTLPQKTVTQITLGEPMVDSHGRIVSKITLESPSSTNDEADLPTLKPTK